MKIKILSWRIEDAESIAKALNNKKVQDNLRDGLPFPYTISVAKGFISAMLTADKNNTFAWAITVDDIYNRFRELLITFLHYEHNPVQIDIHYNRLIIEIICAIDSEFASVESCRGCPEAGHRRCRAG